MTKIRQLLIQKKYKCKTALTLRSSTALETTTLSMAASLLSCSTIILCCWRFESCGTESFAKENHFGNRETVPGVKFGLTSMPPSLLELMRKLGVWVRNCCKSLEVVIALVGPSQEWIIEVINSKYSGTPFRQFFCPIFLQILEFSQNFPPTNARYRTYFA